MNRKNIDINLYGHISPRWAVLLVDVMIVILSYFFAYTARFDLNSIGMQSFDFMQRLIVVVFINASGFLFFKIPSRVLRFSSFSDISRIFISQSSSYLILFIINILVYEYSNNYWFPTGVLLMNFVVGLLMLICLRLIVKMFFEFRNSDKRRDVVRVMIYVAQGKETEVARRLRGDNKQRYRIRGFVSDNFRMKGRYLMAIPVYINDDKLPDIICRHMLDAIVLDSAKIKTAKDSGFLDKLLAKGVKLITLSSEEELRSSRTNSSVKKIMIEDLLMRPPLAADSNKLNLLLEGKRVMVTGSSGSIGSELIKLIAIYKPQSLILIDQSETPMHDLRLMLKEQFGKINSHTIVADITNQSRMEQLFECYRPHYVFHAAAYKHIPLLESNISEAIQVNVLGTCNLADLSYKYGVDKFVMFSTDKAMNPCNVMGASKRLAEIYIDSLNEKRRQNGERGMDVAIIRFGNVLDSNGSVVLRFRDQIERKESLIVTHPEVVRHFITSYEVALLALETCMMKKDGSVYAFDMGEPVKIIDLAKRMINLAGYTLGKDIKIEFAGLRHGEKLSEESFKTDECVPTENERIIKVKVPKYDFDTIQSLINRLIIDSYTADNHQLIEEITEILPEYSKSKS